jgi:transposase
VRSVERQEMAEEAARKRAAMEERRRRGLQLLADGVSARAVAARLGVSHETVQDWREAEAKRRKGQAQ